MVLKPMYVGSRSMVVDSFMNYCATLDIYIFQDEDRFTNNSKPHCPK